MFVAAGRTFEQALARHAESRRVPARARTELAYGEFLRRARRRVDARIHLRAALETFEELGAAPLSDRAAAELRASGETARRRDVSTATDRTPQELNVGRRAVDRSRGRNKPTKARTVTPAASGQRTDSDERGPQNWHYGPVGSVHLRATWGGTAVVVGVPSSSSVVFGSGGRLSPGID